MARLPTPGGDSGNWGSILNDYLSQVHAPDGTLKSDSVTSDAIAPNAIDSIAIADGSITETLLDTAVQTKLNQTAPVINEIKDEYDRAIIKFWPEDPFGDPANYFEMGNNPGTPYLHINGADSNVSMSIRSKGTGSVTIGSHSSFTTTTLFTPVASAVNYLTIKNATTTNPVLLSATGTDTNVSINLVPKGTGVVQANGVEVATTSGAQTLTNKTLADPAVTGATKVAQGGTLELYNTADQTTDYERMRAYYSGSTAAFTIAGESGGTGTTRPLYLGNNSQLRANISSTSGLVSIYYPSTPTAGAIWFKVDGTQAAASGTQYGVQIANTINQTSTAGYTALLINPTETATGSGTKRLIDAQVGGSSKFSVSNTGAVSAAAITSTGRLTVTSNIFDGDAQMAGFAGAMITAVNGNQNFFSITPSINQSGTAGYRALLINATENTTGSGAKRLIDAQVGGTSKFTVDSTGNVSATGSIDAGGVPVVTTSGTQTLTNKTLTSPKITSGNAPATSASTGTTGQIEWDANYIYVCTATDTWVRAPLASW